MATRPQANSSFHKKPIVKRYALVKNIVACVGGGQLAQMLGQAGKGLEITLRSAAKPDSCAFSDCEPFVENLFDQENFTSFIKDVDIFTFESEHEGLEFSDKVLMNNVPIYPPADFVKIAGDRFLEKSYLSNLDIPTAPFELIDTELNIKELEIFLTDLFSSKTLSPNGLVVKTRHGGYDGKGQWVISNAHENDFNELSKEIHSVIKSPGCIVEGLIDFSLECSIIAARSTKGEFASWPLTRNEHQNSILRFSYSPILGLDNLEDLEIQAMHIAQTLCEQSNYIGTIAVECFVANNGLVVNEIAPRVHNSGHWTIEGSKTSQFEQHLRAITGMELGDTSCSGFSAMINLVGVEIDAKRFENQEGIFLHWYGKQVRKDRKVGHLTIIGSSIEQLNERTKKALELI